MPLQSQPRELLVTDLDRDFVMIGVQGSLHDQARARRGTGDQADDRLEAEQRPATPVLRDEAEQPVLDLVPLAGPWWEVADQQRQAEFVGQGLMRPLPPPRPMPV